MKERTETATFVDVRSAGEYAAGHFPGAVNIPLEEVSQRITEFKKMTGPIIAYCRSGNRSGMAVAMLKLNGFTDAINGGGLENLKQKIA
jgi:phage shock protein E